MIEAKIIADSICPKGHRITTYILTFPRMILAELNTHRLFSRNSASSRAIPFNKMLQAVRENPFIPIAWQKDHKGMQGTEYWTTDIDKLELEWLQARNKAVFQATTLHDAGVTKQLCNRLLEPFMWHTVILTATEFENFFALRCPQYEFGDKSYRSCKDLYDAVGSDLDAWPHEDESWWQSINKGQSEIHMMALAEAMWVGYNKSIPQKLKEGEWHIPFGDNIDQDALADIYYSQQLESPIQAAIKIATARCARVSYTVVGEEDKESNHVNDIKLHDRLAESGHWSPFEHCAKVMDDIEYENFTKVMMKKTSIGTNKQYTEKGWCNNFRGFIQYRYLIEE